jgi:N-hydroxyarylamine O-acetyltransferase
VIAPPAAASPSVDLEAYLARIGYIGPREPVLGTLRALARAHVAAIPFEAVDVLLGRGVDLSPQAVDAKLIGARRGGYCFEQNSLFRRVLSTLGFTVSALLARPRWNRPLDEPRAQTHMALAVRIDGADWLADVGFGVCMLTAPVPLASRALEATDHEPVRLSEVGEEIRLEVLMGGDWRAVCDIDPRPRPDVDFLAPNWFTSTHPESPFRQMLICSRTTPDARYALLGNRLTIRRPEVEPAQRVLTADELEVSLAGDFGLPVEPSWRNVLERAAAAETLS